MIGRMQDSHVLPDLMALYIDRFRNQTACGVTCGVKTQFPSRTNSRKRNKNNALQEKVRKFVR